jgi:uncharacterized protein YdeI (YjbR/CyaY-like superfamily)
VEKGKRKAGSALEILDPGTRAAWRAWLARNHARTRGVSLTVYKKKDASGRLTYEEAVEEALCFGWIDSRTNSHDAQSFRVAVNPRRAGSTWSKLNKRRVEQLIAAKRMSPSGLAKIEDARRDGSWNSLDEVEAMVVPPDLGAALAAVPAALSSFEAFNQSYRKIILYWINSARRPQTRAARIEQTVKLSADNNRQFWPRPRS